MTKAIPFSSKISRRNLWHIPNFLRLREKRIAEQAQRYAFQQRNPIRAFFKLTRPGHQKCPGRFQIAKYRLGKPIPVILPVRLFGTAEKQYQPSYLGSQVRLTPSPSSRVWKDLAKACPSGAFSATETLAYDVGSAHQVVCKMDKEKCRGYYKDSTFGAQCGRECITACPLSNKKLK